MKNTLVTLLLILSSIVSYSQVYTFDFYSHTSYTNTNPGLVVLLNDNWSNDIQYEGSGSGYHVTYIYDVYNSTIETIERDSLGAIVESLNTVDDIDVILNDERLLYVYNPRLSKYSLFYFDAKGIPYFVVEDSNGNGFFSSDKDFIYRVD